VVSIANTFLMSTGGSIIDAMCMTVLDEYKVAAQNPHRTPRTARGAEENYGDLRLYSAIGWGGMSLLTGQLIDSFGTSMMFIGFGVIQAVNIIICVVFLPTPKPMREDEVEPAPSATPAQPVNLCSFSVVWFFCNLILYGLGMCLIENFLFVFLIQEFDDTPNLLLGASTAIMCLFEIPVFKFLGSYFKKQPSESGITLVLFGCQMIVALRCWLYLLIPKDQVWLVLLVEPLHGICFAGMWGATMEYAKRLAGNKNVAQMTALVNGVYYQVSMGIGSFVWGSLVSKPPTGLGFRGSFVVDIFGTIIWSIIWQMGLLAIAYCGRGARQVEAPEAREGLKDS